MDRSYGVLMALSSLPGDFGIGTMGESAREFIDSLANAGAHWWQLLPLTQPGPGDSPYQSVSAFAGSYFYLDLELLRQDGLLTADEVESARLAFESDDRADYTALNEHRLNQLRPAFDRANSELRAAALSFAAENPWAGDYAEFMSEQLGFEPEFYLFLQVLFERQWQGLRDYAHSKGVSLIGDMPIYVAPGGVEARFNPELFDKNGRVAGVPPDAFSEDGQHWGNPVYDWQAMKNDGYGWWIRRFALELSRFDLVRVDHFRGFEAYWAIPGDAETAAEGEWVEGPGAGFFDVLNGWFGGLPVIAEDLGSLTPSFFKFMESCGFPGLKVLQFAFEPGANSAYLPHNCIKNSVVYTGTHDNNTSLGWWRGLDAEHRKFTDTYLGGGLSEENICDRLISAAMTTVCDICILPIQDILCLGGEARMNVPGTPAGNWSWRMEKGAFSAGLQRKLRELARACAR